jgi:hypothetical protein
MLVTDTTRRISAIDCQLTLPFAMPQRPNIVRFLPRHQYSCLAYGVYDTFENVPEAAKAAQQLEANHIFLIGQLVQLTEEQVRAFPFMNDTIIRVMKDELEVAGLGFGTRVPSWNKRFRTVLAALP